MVTIFILPVNKFPAQLEKSPFQKWCLKFESKLHGSGSGWHWAKWVSILMQQNWPRVITEIKWWVYEASLYYSIFCVFLKSSVVKNCNCISAESLPMMFLRWNIPLPVSRSNGTCSPAGKFGFHLLQISFFSPSTDDSRDFRANISSKLTF